MNLLAAVFVLIPCGEEMVVKCLQLAGREPDRIGLVLIVGNTVTHDRIILKQLDFSPGQILQYRKLREAELKLLWMGIFDLDDPPKIEVIPREDCPISDIRVSVKETRLGMVRFFPNLRVYSDTGVNSNILRKK